MAITRSRGDVQPQSGNNTQIIIAEQANASWTDISKRVADAYRHQPLITSADLAQTGEIIPNNYFDGQASQNKGIDGPLDISNGLTLSLSGNGTALFFRMLTQDKNPTRFDADGSAYSARTPITVVTSTNIFTGTAGETVTFTVANDLASAVSPVQLTISPGGTPTLLAGRAFGTVTITGTDHMDRDITDNVNFYAGSLGTAQRTNFYFKTVRAASATGFTAGTVAIAGTDGGVRVRFTPQDADLVAYWTAEIAKGNIPNTYYSLILQSATMAIADRTSLVQFECAFLGREANVYSAIDRTSTTRSDASALAYASPDVFPGWRASLNVGSFSLAATSATLTINQNLEYTNVLGGRYQESPPLRGDKRALTVEMNILYDQQNNLSELFTNNQSLRDVSIQMTNTAIGAYPHKFDFQIDEAQLTADPDPGVADFGAIGQTVTIQGISTRRGLSEFRIVADYSDYAELADFS